MSYWKIGIIEHVEETTNKTDWNVSDRVKSKSGYAGVDRRNKDEDRMEGQLIIEDSYYLSFFRRYNEQLVNTRYDSKKAVQIVAYGSDCG